MTTMPTILEVEQAVRADIERMAGPVVASRCRVQINAEYINDPRHNHAYRRIEFMLDVTTECGRIEQFVMDGTTNGLLQRFRSNILPLFDKTPQDVASCAAAVGGGA